MSAILNGKQFRSVNLKDLPELSRLFGRIEETYKPIAVFLYGSQVRGDAGRDSDWDLKILVPDDAGDDLLCPLLGWRVQEESGVYADVSCARISEFAADMLVPNTAAQEILRDGALIETR
jgi:hypothetical protein